MTTIKRVPREIIESQLLIALDDKDKVAILANQEDLKLIIDCLLCCTEETRAEELAIDLTKLMEEMGWI